MKCESVADAVYKEVVVIGNGPSGIVLSYMLSGNLPHLTSNLHPDEMLLNRLEPFVNQCLVRQDLGHLASGLEGRSTNPVSLLMDSLLHPYADIGLEIPPLVEFRKTGCEIDHIVLGKGPPGGSWHYMDPHILTLSLGSWMSLPGLPFHCRDSGEKRAFASSVANYYERYVHEMHLTKYFKNEVLVTDVKPRERIRKSFCIERESNVNWVKKINNKERADLCIEIEPKKDKSKNCLFTNAINFIWEEGNKRLKTRCKRPREQCIEADQRPNRRIREVESVEVEETSSLPKSYRKCDNRSTSLCYESDNMICDNFYSSSLDSRFSSGFSSKVPYSFRRHPSTCCEEGKKVNWLVDTYDINTGERITYSCTNLVLANGCNDLPNRLQISQTGKDPDWLVHDLCNLEEHLDEECSRKNLQDLDPVLIVGAGLSAADAIIAVRGRNVPVAHVFRNKSDLNKQLPENMYPEYHKVHQMMKDGGSTYPLYKSYPEYIPTEIDDVNHTVTLLAKSGEYLRIKVSYIAVLIGSRPDLTFMPEYLDLGIYSDLPIDTKTNVVNVNKLSHKITGYDNLFAIGQLAGDNFVRFIPGGALSVVNELYKQNDHSIL